MKVRLYFNFIKVKTVRIKEGVDWNQVYRVTVWGKKKMFGYHRAEVVLKPVKLLRSEDDGIDIETRIYEGADV